jgi:hypothetical protein
MLADYEAPSSLGRSMYVFIWAVVVVFGGSLIAFLGLTGWEARQAFRAAPESQRNKPASAADPLVSTQAQGEEQTAREAEAA